MVQLPLKSKQLWTTAQAFDKNTLKSKPSSAGYLLLPEGLSPQQPLSPPVVSASLLLVQAAAG